MHAILFIARIFPPWGGSAVQRPAKLAKYFPSFGILPHVITGPSIVPLSDDSLLSEIPDSVPVHRVFTFEPDILRLLINKNQKSGDLFRLFLKIVLKCYSIVYCRIAFPDQFIGWAPFSFITSLLLIRKNNLELIYVHGQPACSMLIGYFLKKVTHKPLVVDYTDPWMATPGYYPQTGFIGRRSKAAEKIILNAADLVFYVKKSIYDDIAVSYQVKDTHKYIFMPHGYDAADFSPRSISRGLGKFKIVYTGKLTKKYCYSPESFFKALQGLLKEDKINADSIEVVCAGLISQEYLALIRDWGLQNIIRHIGYVSHKESIALIQSSDALFLAIESEKGKQISESFSGSLPAKIFEYLYTGRPVLAIIPHGFEYELIQKSNLGFFAEPNNPGSVKDALENLLLSSHSDKNKPQPNWEFIHSFDRKNLTEKLAGHLLRVIAQDQDRGLEP